MSENIYTKPSIKSKETSGESRCPVTAMGEAFNPFTDPYISNPYDFYAQTRANEPVFYSPEIDHWVISSFSDVRTILRDSDTYSSRMAQSPIKPWPQEAIDMLNAENFNLVPNLSNNDPPSHKQVRSFLNNAFTPKRIKWLEPYVHTIVTNSIDSFIHKGKTDLVADMLYETPAQILLTFLGIPQDDIDKVKIWSAGRALLTWGKLSDEEIIEQMPDFIDYLRYCYDLVDTLEKNLDNNSDDYTSELLRRLKTENPEGFDKNRIVITIFGLLMAGHETTTNQSGLGIRALLNNREAWNEIIENPKLIPNAVEEIIRYDSSVVSWRRVTNKEVEINGMKIPEGEQLLIMLGSANRDEAHFKNADSFDIHRKNANQHMSFGHGIHYCLGAPLARLELKIMLEELSQRLPTLDLVENQDYTYSANTSHRGPSSLLVTWET